MFVFFKYRHAVRQANPTTRTKNSREINRHLKSNVRTISELSTRSSLNACQISHTKGKPAAVPKTADTPLKRMTSRYNPGARRFLEAPRAIRTPSCLDLCRKNNPSA